MGGYTQLLREDEDSSFATLLGENRRGGGDRHAARAARGRGGRGAVFNPPRPTPAPAGAPASTGRRGSQKRKNCCFGFGFCFIRFVALEDTERLNTQQSRAVPVNA